MNKTLGTILVLFCMVCFSFSPAQAAPFDVYDGPVYAHRGPDGTISFLAGDTARNWFIRFHKVLTVEGKTYYFLYIRADNKNFATKPVPTMTLGLDGKTFPLQLMEGVKYEVDKESLCAWYSVPDEAVKLLPKATQMSLSYQFEGEKPVVWKPFQKALEGFKKVPSMGKNAYVREGQIMDPTREPEKAVFYPQIFIPNAKPEDITDAMIYETNFSSWRGKEEVEYSEGYLINRTKDPEIIQLEWRKSFDRATDIVTLTCRPYNNGVWVTVGLMRKEYSSNSASYRSYEDASSWMSFVDAKDFWRTNSFIWGMRLHSVYNALYGRFDYGLTWEVKDVKRGPFKLTAVNSQKFPALAGVKAGDLLIAIDDTPTSQMGTLDIEYWLDNGFAGPRTFTIKTAAGEEKKITVTPQLRLADPAKRKDYKKILAEKLPKWFWNKEVIYPLGAEATYYHPLGTGIK